jgi:hypothetical protein
MIKSHYLLEKPAAPSAPKLLLDQRVMLALIDSAARVEAVLERVALRTKRAPLPSVFGMMLGATLLGYAVARRWRVIPSSN